MTDSRSARSDGDAGPELSARDIRFFKEHGYLVKRGLLPAPALEACLDQVTAPSTSPRILW